MNFHSPEITAAVDCRMPENSGPDYPKFGTTVTKWHKLPRTPENIAGHFDALMTQLATRQRAQLAKAAVPERTAPCASRTWHTCGKKILAAVNAQNRAVTAGALAESWRKRTDAQVGLALALTLAGEDTPLTVDIYVPKDGQPADPWKRGRR